MPKKIRDLMTAAPSTATLESTAEELAAIMREEDIGSVPIVSEEGELAGIVTDRDIVIRCIAEGKEVTACTAEELMTGDVHQVAPEMGIELAARLMRDHQVRRLPVVEDGRLVGMIALGDLAVKSEDDGLKGNVIEDISKGVKQDPGVKSHPAREMGPQSGASRAANKTSPERRPKAEPESPGGRQPEGLRSDSSPSKQGIANRSAAEENRRQSKVVPFRRENEARNTRVGKPQPKPAGGRKSG